MKTRRLPGFPMEVTIGKETKVCAKCKKEKLLDDFYKKLAMCKICCGERNIKYYRENKEKCRIYSKEYNKKNYPEIKIKRAEQRKQFRLTNKERLAAISRKYWADTKERREANIDEVRARTREYYKDHSETIKIQRKKRYSENKKVQDYHKSCNERRYREKKEEILANNKRNYEKDPAKFNAMRYFQRKISTKLVPKKLIEYKKQQILLKRALKFQTQHNDNKE